jgi:isoleucyl-tRNA synthetase
VIGHSLDSSVTLGLSNDLFAVLSHFQDDLRSIFIVSQASMVVGEIVGAYAGQETEGVWVKVAPAGGEKCQRCWVYDDSVGENCRSSHHLQPLQWCPGTDGRSGCGIVIIVL